MSVLKKSKYSFIKAGTFLFLSVFVLFSLISYNASDSSLNVATGDEVQNMIGVFGATISDLLLQLCGFAAFMIPVILFSWSISLVVWDIDLLWIRIPSLIASIFGLSSMLGSLEYYNFTFQMLPGGYIGFFLNHKIQSFLGSQILSILFSSLVFGLFFATAVGEETIRFVFGESFSKVTSCIQRGIIEISSFIWRFFNPFYAILKLIDFAGLIRSKSSKIAQAQKIRRFNSSADRQEHQSKVFLSKSYENKSNEIELGHKDIRSSSRSLNEVRAQSGNRILSKKEFGSRYAPPPLSLLTVKAANYLEDSQFAKERSAKLTKILHDFGVRASIVSVSQGPVVSLFEVELSPGIKASRVVGLASDIARLMSAPSARVDMIPYKETIGIEISNPNRVSVMLGNILSSNDFLASSGGMSLPIVLGQDVFGRHVIEDLATMPHLLVAGTTGSGKSVGINCMILSLLYRFGPEMLKLVMIDPKMLEFSVYQDIPHLLSPVVTESKQAIFVLKWVVKEMEKRYKSMSEIGVRNIAGYNEKMKVAKSRNAKISKVRYKNSHDGQQSYETFYADPDYMPYIVVIIDEVADLMLVAGKEFESLVQRLSQMARAAGIHLIMATQRPSVDVITGVIKSNFPTRISYQLATKIDSRTIINSGGAEYLLGKGDMLYMKNGGKLSRIHGPFVSDDEITKVISFLKSNYKVEYENIDFDEVSKENTSDTLEDEEDVLYPEAVQIVIKQKKASISYLQRVLRVGYNRAANLMQVMEDRGIVSVPHEASKQRTVLVTEDPNVKDGDV